MKQTIIFFTLLVFPIISWGQRTTFYSTIKEKGYANLEVSFISKMETAAKELDKCYNNKCILTDPIKNKQASAKEQINLASSLGKYPLHSVQKSMVQFEEQLLKSKKFPRKQLETAFKKHPGYTFSTMSSRMRFYIKSMESIEDDE